MIVWSAATDAIRSELAVMWPYALGIGGSIIGVLTAWRVVKRLVRLSQGGYF